MSIEQQLSDLTIAVRALTVAIGSIGAAAGLATAGAGEAGKSETEKKGPGRPKKEEATGKNAGTPADSTPAAGNASGGDSKQTQTATGKAWTDVVAKIKELLGSKEDGHGKPAVEKILAKFGLEGKKVPALEALGKHDEVFAAVDAILKGTATEESDEDDILG